MTGRRRRSSLLSSVVASACLRACLAGGGDVAPGLALALLDNLAALRRFSVHVVADRSNLAALGPLPGPALLLDAGGAARLPWRRPADCPVALDRPAPGETDADSKLFFVWLNRSSPAGELGALLGNLASTVYNCPLDVRPGRVYHHGNLIAFLGLGDEGEKLVFGDSEVRRHQSVASFKVVPSARREDLLLMSRYSIYEVPGTYVQEVT